MVEQNREAMEALLKKVERSGKPGDDEAAAQLRAKLAALPAVAPAPKAEDKAPKVIEGASKK